MAKEVKGNPEMVQKSPYHTVIDHLDETCACAYKKRPLLDFLAEVFFFSLLSRNRYSPMFPEESIL
jgi:hypothetical protein